MSPKTASLFLFALSVLSLTGSPSAHASQSDVTTAYQAKFVELRQALKEEDGEIEDLKSLPQLKSLRKNFRVLFIPGFYNILGNLNSFSGGAKTDQAELYFKDQLATLDELDVEARMVSVDAVKSESDKSGLDFLERELRLTYQGNYSRLADKVRTSWGIGSGGRTSFWRDVKPKKVFLVSHSRGGLDVLELLLKRPAVIPYVAGWVSLQTPFEGTLLADYLYQARARVSDEDIAQVIEMLKNFKRTEKLGASAEENAPLLDALAEVFGHLTTARRVEYLTSKSAEILALEKRLPIISVATAQGKENSDPAEALISSVMEKIFKIPVEAPNTLLAPTRNWLLTNTGLQNDGFAPTQSQAAIGNIVQLNGLDHFETVISLHEGLPFQSLLQKLPGSQFRRVGFLALLTMAAKK